MNLTRVLNVALPEIPARSLTDRPPRMPPDVVFKEHVEDGEPIVRVVVPDGDMMYRFTPANWSLMQLFDGRRSYEEVAELYSRQTGQRYDGDDMREFAASLEELKFWHKTPQEKNVQLMQKSAEERRKLLNSRKSKFGDLSEIAFPAVNPDKFLTWAYKYIKFVYSWWFGILTLVMFGICVAISVAHWDEIGRDTAEFFAFSNMSWGDLVVFYILALLTMCWHELAHGLTCKHYGARVPAMGFLLVYLAPAFYTDTSEGFVVATRYQRFIIAMSGAWSELYLYAVATPIWWGTPPGSSAHNAAYLVMLMTGIAGLFINWNPLIKLDGYYMLCEVLGIGDLKEASSAYASAWTKRHIWRLPVDVPYVPKKRRLGFVVYALMSGLYSYTILYILARFTGNVFRNFNPEWSFIPELATAGLIFRSRILKLVNFMKFVYLDKKDRLRAWLVSAKGLATAASVLLFLIVPIWRESADGRFVLEALRTANIRNMVGGTVEDVYVEEGTTVEIGSSLFKLRSLRLQSKVAENEADLHLAAIKVKDAQLHHVDLGTALEENERAAQQNSQLKSEAGALQIKSPIAGKVITPRPGNWLGANVQPGTELVEVADLSEILARVYVSDYDMSKIHLRSKAGLTVEGIPRLWSSQVAAIMPSSTGINAKIAEREKYNGLNASNFYVVYITLANPDDVLKPGMTGEARIYGERRSLLSHLLHESTRFFGRKAW